MELSTEILARFVGGDIEIQNGGENYLFRGPIKTATVDGEDVIIEFEWTAKNDGGPNRPTKTWTIVGNKIYAISMMIYSASESDGRMILQSSIMCELTVLFPPGGSKLDPGRVSGL